MRKTLQHSSLLLLLASNALLANTGLAALEQLVAQNSYQQAWQEAQRLAKANEGDPRFDYLYGLSALETGHYDLAVFALDRVVVNQPHVIRPRLELARAYLQIHNEEAALHEFRQVLRLDPPASVRQNVNQYVTRLTAPGKSNAKHVLDGLVSLVGGYDSNANFGAGQSIFDTPIFGQVTLKDQSVKQGSLFTELRGQLNFRYLASENLTWFATGKLGQKHYSKAGDFDLGSFELHAGGLLTQGAQQYQLSLRHQGLQLDGESFSRTTGIEANVGHELGHNQTVGAGLLLEKLDHQQQDLQDARRVQFNGNYRLDDGKLRHQANVLAGRENAQQAAGKHYGYRMLGVAYNLAYAWTPAQVSSVGLQYQQRRHQAPDPVYQTTRSDKRLTLQASHSISLSKNVSAQVQAGYVHNQSNLGLYQTDKSFVQTGLNYHF